MGCPGNETVLRFVAGRLEAGAATVIRRHLGSCAICTALVADLERSAKPPGTVPAKGEILGGKYRVEKTIGMGGMGVVLAATHLELGRQVAIKVMHAELQADAPLARRLLREARAAALLRNVNTVHVYDVDRLPNGTPYIVMELLEGRDLGAIVKETGPLSVADATSYMLDACNALAEAHERGIVHRDVKPQNVFLTSNFVVKVLDFGLAKRMPQEAPSPVSSGLTLPDTAVGSPFWMSPEQVRSGPVDARTDVWGVGVTLYFLLTGEAPFTAPQLLLLTARILSDPPVAIESRRRGVPEPVEAVVLRCLAKQPSARFQSIGELAAALRATRLGGDVGSAADTTPMSCPPTHVETGTMTTRKHPVKKRR